MDYNELLYKKIRKIIAEQNAAQTTTQQQQPPPASEQLPAEPEQQEQPEPAEKDEDLYTHKTLIKLFNAVRSGKSMKDKIVVGKLEEWWGNISDDEKKTFLTTLARIAKIVHETDTGDDNEEETTSQETKTAPTPLPLQPSGQNSQQPAKGQASLKSQSV